MSSSNSNRRRQQRGKSTNKNQDNGKTGSTSGQSKKKGLSDHVFYLGSAKQASDYETTYAYIINHVRKTFNFGNDIATALEDLVDYRMAQHLPTLKQAADTNPPDPAHKALLQSQYEMIFKAEYDSYMKRAQAYDNNLTKAYALIWEQCAKGMQHKIENRSDYSTTIKGNPIQLLTAIKEHALNYQETRYAMAIVHDSWMTFLHTKQRDGESLSDYTK